MDEGQTLKDSTEYGKSWLVTLTPSSGPTQAATSLCLRVLSRKMNTMYPMDML